MKQKYIVIKKIYNWMKQKYIVMKKISQLKNINCDYESSPKFHGNKIRPVFSAFGSEKQKKTTCTSVRWRTAEEPSHEFDNVHGACDSHLSAGDSPWRL